MTINVSPLKYNTSSSPTFFIENLGKILHYNTFFLDFVRLSSVKLKCLKTCALWNSTLFRWCFFQKLEKISESYVKKTNNLFSGHKLNKINGSQIKPSFERRLSSVPTLWEILKERHDNGVSRRLALVQQNRMSCTAVKRRAFTDGKITDSIIKPLCSLL